MKVTAFENVEMVSTTVKGGAARHGLSQSLVRQAIRDKKLKVHRVGRRVVILLASLDSWVAGQS
jgi:excisionase family DNA binding protein